MAMNATYCTAETARVRSSRRSVGQTPASAQGVIPQSQNLLQRKSGACACGGTCPRCQAKSDLAISQPHDPAELEADRIADRVMRMKIDATHLVASDTTGLQRTCAACKGRGEEPFVQAKDESLSASARGIGANTPASVREVLNSPGEPLPPEARAFFEPRFGYDFGHVRVHTDSKSGESAQGVNALAYTVGRDVVFGKGQYSPSTEKGRWLLAHELSHVTQQRRHDGNGAKLQRAPLPCTSRKTLDVYAVNLPGATRAASGDISNANSLLCQCGLSLNLAGGESWQTNLMDKQPPNNVLNEYSSPGSPTDEEKDMLAYQPGGDAIHLYYVPSLSSGSEAEAFWTSGFPTVNNGVAISNSARACAVAHEIGHVLLDDGGHHSNKDNLMASGSINTCKGELEQSQCDKMP